MTVARVTIAIPWGAVAENRESEEFPFLAGATGLEPVTNCLEGSYSIQLSYAPRYFESGELLASSNIVSVPARTNQVNARYRLRMFENPGVDVASSRGWRCLERQTPDRTGNGFEFLGGGEGNWGRKNP